MKPRIHQLKNVTFTSIYCNGNVPSLHAIQATLRALQRVHPFMRTSQGSSDNGNHPIIQYNDSSIPIHFLQFSDKIKWEETPMIACIQPYDPSIHLWRCLFWNIPLLFDNDTDDNNNDDNDNERIDKIDSIPIPPLYTSPILDDKLLISTTLINNTKDWKSCLYDSYIRSNDNDDNDNENDNENDNDYDYDDISNNKKSSYWVIGLQSSHAVMDGMTCSTLSGDVISGLKAVMIYQKKSIECNYSRKDLSKIDEILMEDIALAAILGQRKDINGRINKSKDILLPIIDWGKHLEDITRKQYTHKEEEALKDAYLLPFKKYPVERLTTDNIIRNIPSSSTTTTTTTTTTTIKSLDIQLRHRTTTRMIMDKDMSRRVMYMIKKEGLTTWPVLQAACMMAEAHIIHELYNKSLYNKKKEEDIEKRVRKKEKKEKILYLSPRLIVNLRQLTHPPLSPRVVDTMFSMLALPPLKIKKSCSLFDLARQISETKNKSFENGIIIQRTCWDQTKSDSLAKCAGSLSSIGMSYLGTLEKLNPNYIYWGSDNDNDPFRVLDVAIEQNRKHPVASSGSMMYGFSYKFKEQFSIQLWHDPILWGDIPERILIHMYNILVGIGNSKKKQTQYILKSSL